MGVYAEKKTQDLLNKKHECKPLNCDIQLSNFNLRVQNKINSQIKTQDMLHHKILHVETEQITLATICTVFLIILPNAVHYQVAESEPFDTMTIMTLKLVRMT